MSCLLDELPVVALREDRNARVIFRTTSPVPYRLRSGELLTIPAGFTTDFTSMPRLLWSIEPPTGRAMFAALPHDWGYASMWKPRADVDLIFLHELEDLGMSWIKRSAMYRGVRLGGSAGYGRPEEHAHALGLLAGLASAKQDMADAFASLGECAVAP